jgi:ketosteroid isomerase-like protein
MKKIYLLSAIAVMVITACQQTPKTVPVDMEAEKAALKVLFNKFDSAFEARDVTTLASFLTDDALCLGTDPSEFMTKQQITDLWTQMLADSTVDINYIREREIKVAADGRSAAVVDQYMMPGISPKIPWRNVYHLVKTNDNWMILFFSCSFIPKNEDLQRLNDALD